MGSGQWSKVMHLFSHSYSALPCDGFLHAVSVRVVGNDDLPGVTRYALHPGLKHCAHSGRVFWGIVVPRGYALRAHPGLKHCAHSGRVFGGIVVPRGYALRAHPRL